VWGIVARAHPRGRQAVRRPALEIAHCARPIKGYGATLKRGVASHGAIEARIVAPVLAGRMPPRQGIDAVASARTAALLDPEGESLARALADIESAGSQRPHGVASVG
jgi:indolepyruvate ferredoxin oxidoreductase, beta subunit